MRIHILTDNRASKRGILAEHGLAIFIEHETFNLLFDTGQSGVYVHNAAQMGVDLGQTDYLVLSHGHYDHVGGLLHFPQKDKLPSVYVREDAFRKRYKRLPGENKYGEVGIPWAPYEYDFLKKKIVFTPGVYELVPGVTLCGAIPQSVDFEEVTPGFYWGEGTEKEIDSFRDEQMVVLEREERLYVFLGCSHPGVINCLHYVQKIFPGKRIDTLVAGMHLSSVSPLRVQKTIQYLREINLQNVIPLHCTGIMAITEMKRALGRKCSLLCAGDSWEIF